MHQLIFKTCQSLISQFFISYKEVLLLLSLFTAISFRNNCLLLCAVYQPGHNLQLHLQVLHTWELNISFWCCSRLDDTECSCPLPSATLQKTVTPCRLPSGNHSKLHNWITRESIRWLHSKHSGWLLYHLDTSMLQTRNNEQHRETSWSIVDV